MPLVEAISWQNATPDQIAVRYPNVSLKFGSQVIVMENQWAVFFRDGKALDVFGPGRHTISSNNISLLTGLLKSLRLIGDIFECEVIFITNSQMRANFGGKGYSAPSGQIQYQAEISFFGYLLYKVEDPRLFVTEFFGNRKASTSADVENYIRGFVIERVIDAFAEYETSSLVKNVDETTDKIALIINDEARRVGLIIIDTTFEGLNIPEEARRFASGMGQQAMAMQYAKETAAVLPSDGGAAGAGLGAGLGLSLGAQMMRSAQTEAQPQQVVICNKCGSQNRAGQKYCGNCGSNLMPPRIVKCPNCQTENPETMKFCGNCGKPLQQVEITCSKCGTKNQAGTKFCGNCGEKLS
ncbi:SPFH domain-containing protein [Candidatus Bathyarchaeota archaeon]|nr:SPFH domain-containing protein [Candidatus Bathyarchaeota archaeon]